MKITYKKYNAVASWRWDIQPLPEPGPGPETTAAAASLQQAKRAADLEDWQDQDSLDGMDQDWQESEPDEDDEVCGICQLEFESACPGCKVPGDDCPLSESRERGPYVDSSTNLYMISVGTMYSCVSHALSFKMAQYRKQQGTVSVGSKAMG